ncbi:hypothetical protein D3C84_968550 [compost metagenome]
MPWAMLSAMRLAVCSGPMMLTIAERPSASSNNRLAISTPSTVRLALLMACAVPWLVCCVLLSISSLRAAIWSSSWLKALLKVPSSCCAASGFSSASPAMRSAELM